MTLLSLETGEMERKIRFKWSDPCLIRAYGWVFGYKYRNQSWCLWNVKREGDCGATVEDAFIKVGGHFFFFAMLSYLQEFPQPGMEPAYLAVKSWSPTHWTARVFSLDIVWTAFVYCCYTTLSIVSRSSQNSVTQIICLFCSFLIFPFAEHKEINLSATRWNTSVMGSDIKELLGRKL